MAGHQHVAAGHPGFPYSYNTFNAPPQAGPVAQTARKGSKQHPNAQSQPGGRQGPKGKAKRSRKTNLTDDEDRLYKADTFPEDYPDRHCQECDYYGQSDRVINAHVKAAVKNGDYGTRKVPCGKGQCNKTFCSERAEEHHQCSSYLDFVRAKYPHLPIVGYPPLSQASASTLAGPNDQGMAAQQPLPPLVTNTQTQNPLEITAPSDKMEDFAPYGVTSGQQPGTFDIGSMDAGFQLNFNIFPQPQNDLQYNRLTNDSEPPPLIFGGASPEVSNPDTPMGLTSPRFRGSTQIAFTSPSTTTHFYGNPNGQATQQQVAAPVFDTSELLNWEEDSTTEVDEMTAHVNSDWDASLMATALDSAVTASGGYFNMSEGSGFSQYDFEADLKDLERLGVPLGSFDD